MKIKEIRIKIIYSAIIVISIFLLLFLITNTWIGYQTKNLCIRAQKLNNGNCVEALISQLEDTHQSINDRNDAIWALGKLGDKRALPVLKKYYNDTILSKEQSDKSLNQYELEKAIKNTNSEISITRFLWSLSIKTN